MIYTGTFSKTVAPSMRVGWICAPSAVIRKLVLIKQAADLATSALNQMILLEMADHFDAEAVRVGAIYRARRDTMLAALDRHMPPGVAWERPDGGLYVWLTLPKSLNGAQLAEQALEIGVSVIGGEAFFPVDPDRSTIRLSFSLASEADAEEGVRRLGELLSSALTKGMAEASA